MIDPPLFLERFEHLLFFDAALDFRLLVEHCSDFAIRLDFPNLLRNFFGFRESSGRNQIVVLLYQGLDLLVGFGKRGGFQSNLVFDLRVSLIQFDHGFVLFRPFLHMVGHTIDHTEKRLALSAIDFSLGNALPQTLELFESFHGLIRPSHLFGICDLTRDFCKPFLTFDLILASFRAGSVNTLWFTTELQLCQLVFQLSKHAWIQFRSLLESGFEVA